MRFSQKYIVIQRDDGTSTHIELRQANVEAVNVKRKQFFTIRMRKQMKLLSVTACALAHEHSGKRKSTQLFAS